MDFWLNQALGLLGSLIVFISVQFNNRRVILAAQAAACLMWIVHYGLLGAMTAATINILSFARSVVFYFNDARGCGRFWRCTSSTPSLRGTDRGVCCPASP